MLILIRPERIATSRHNSRPGGSSIVLLWGLFLDAAQGPGGGLDELHLCFCRNGGYTGALIEWAKAMFGYSLRSSSATNNTCFAYCQNAGSSNAPSHGSTGRAAYPKTTNCAMTQLKP